MKQNIKAKIVADSVNPKGQRIVSFLLTYPRFIHSELMTHRVFSRNAASSRAIPIGKQIAAVTEKPARPERWGTNGAGMQDHGTHANLSQCELLWDTCAKHAVSSAHSLERLGLHKQIVNRVLEPFNHITVLVTSTCWTNFFKLRAHKDAQPEFQVLAYRMLALFLENTPHPLEWGDWHLPFFGKGYLEISAGLTEDGEQCAINQSVASAARTSYTTHDKEFTAEKQANLVARLAQSCHWSPFEHQAQAAEHLERSNNFVNGWQQYRSMLDPEPEQPIDFAQILADKPDWIQL